MLAEILPHKDEIDPKYSHLFSAPVADDAGLPSVIRFSRKTQEHYVQTEDDGKPTGWAAYYRDGKWQVEKKAARKKAAAKKKAPAKKKAAAKKSAPKKAPAKPKGG